MQNKQRLELVDYEAENLARLQKTFSRKWEFIFIQAEAQAKWVRKGEFDLVLGWMSAASPHMWPTFANSEPWTCQICMWLK